MDQSEPFIATMEKGSPTVTIYGTEVLHSLDERQDVEKNAFHVPCWRINKLNMILIAASVVSIICLLSGVLYEKNNEASEFLSANFSTGKYDMTDFSPSGPKRSLLLLRHAKSSWDDQSLTDFDRHLSQDGVDAANRLGLFLNQHNVLPPDIIIASPSVRTRETLNIVQKYWSLGSPVEYDDELYSLALSSYSNYILQLNSTFNRILLVGHNPSMQMVAAQLLSRPKIVRKFPPCSFLEIVWQNAGLWNEISEGSGEATIFVPSDAIR